MLLSIHHLTGQRLRATDGELGEVLSFYFDDRTWTIRYLVVRTGRWFGKEVLLSPEAVGKPDPANESLLVDLTQEQIKAAPEVDLAKPVSRREEEALAIHYGWPMSAPVSSLPIVPPVVPAPEEPKSEPVSLEEAHLRSSREVIGYDTRASDGDIGHVADFIYDDDEWVIRYLVVATGGWLPGRRVLVLPATIREIDWGRSRVDLDMTRQTVKDSPPFDPERPVNREYEEVLVDYHGRPRYWRPS